MSMQVFECDHCQKPFQVGAEHAGQQVRCPACEKVVTIPQDAFATPPTEAATKIFACPQCEGQFQVQPSADEQTVGCPHCQRSVKIPGDPDLAGPQIKTKVRRRKKSEKADRGRPNFKAPSENPDLSAPPKKSGPRQSKSPAPDAPAASKKKDQRSPTKPSAPAKGPSNPSTAAAEPKSKVQTREKLATPEPQRGKQKTSTQASKSAAQQGQPARKPSSAAATKIAAEAPTTKPVDTAAADSPQEPSDTRESIDHLLPPRFDVEDPEQMAIRVGRTDTKVLLPDASGGTAQVDKRVVRVQHGDDMVSLVVLSPQQRARRRLIRNLITIAIAIIAMAIAFAVLR